MVYHVYLVDDDRFLLDMYAAKFKNAGHEITAFASGEELIAALRKGGSTAPDAILLDVGMPDMTGFETLEVLRKERLAEGSKIIFLSNQGQTADIENAEALAADGCITKASAIPSDVFAETIRIIETKEKTNSPTV